MPGDASTDQAYIQIPVNEKDPETEKELCFIAKPFVDDTVMLSTAIERVAHDLELKPRDLELDPNNKTILTGSANYIRNAKVVVAILHDNNKDTTANPNVMYELGVAHALGKPTLIFANTSENLEFVPVMIKGLPMESLDPEQYGNRKVFHESLLKLLEDKRGASYSNLLWPDARPLGDSLPMKLIMDESFRAQLKYLCEFGWLVQTEFDQLSGKLTPLTKPSLEQTMAFEQQPMDFDRRSLDDFIRSFFQYTDSYKKSKCVRDHSTLRDLFGRTQDALVAFSAFLPERKLEELLHESFEGIRANASGFPELHDALLFDVRNVFEEADNLDACLSLIEKRLNAKRMIHLPTAIHAKSRRMLNTCQVLVSQAGLFLKQVAKALLQITAKV